MNESRYRKLVGLLLAFLVLTVSFSPQMRYFFSLPSYQKIAVGDQISLNIDNLRLSQQIKQNLILCIKDTEKQLFDTGPQKKNALVAMEPGTANLQLKLFGLIPLKSMQVDIVPSIKVIPGGHSIGVLLHSNGVLVVGQSVVEDPEGNKSNPAKEAGIEVGDIILKINGQEVSSDEEVAQLVDRFGKTGKIIKMEIKRNKKISIKEVKPSLCKETSRYRIGLYIRDTAAGVGTVTFYQPDTKRYGALGHVITDADTNNPIDIADGKIVRAGIQGIQAGRRGQPGEKIGMFIEDKKFQGNIQKNCKFGIYGTLNKPLKNPFYGALPVAFADQIKEGEAEILTVLDGEKIKKFRIEIEKVMPDEKNTGKGMVIRVTDPELLKRTGGIIQGMSGSPIIQNGKVVGAVTHVFINNPTKGYGCLIEWMLEEAKISTKKPKNLGYERNFYSSHYFCTTGKYIFSTYVEKANECSTEMRAHFLIYY